MQSSTISERVLEKDGETIGRHGMDTSPRIGDMRAEAEALNKTLQRNLP
jgi:hypothetical protein